jgi:hypothetical protein
MKQPLNIGAAEKEFGLAFKIIAGLEPKITIVGKDVQQRSVVAVHYPGDELVRAMQIEAFIAKQGDSIIHRSQLKYGNTLLVYRVEPRHRK